MFKDIFSIIRKDLKGYGQHTLAPKSLTINENGLFRHYELGPVFGVVCFNGDHVFFCDIKEDDGNWYCFEETGEQFADAFWMKAKIELYTRMLKWLDNNMERSYYSGFEGQEGYECGYKNLKK